MTISSMTGFARTEGEIGDINWSWEIKSVNGKGLDVRFRLPAGYEGLEIPARKLVSGGFARGQMTANLQVRRNEKAQALQVNREVLETLLAVSDELVDAGRAERPRADGLLALRGVLESIEADLETGEEKAAREKQLLQGLEQAVEALAGSRKSEGAALLGVIHAQLDNIEKLTLAARELEETRPDAIRSRLQGKISELLERPDSVSEERLAQEVALLTVKADVREELDRLDAHIAAARELLAQTVPIGRKLDFLAQEFNREANTLCSKAADIALTGLGLELKTVIDQMREQAQNVE